MPHWPFLRRRQPAASAAVPALHPTGQANSRTWRERLRAPFRSIGRAWTRFWSWLGACWPWQRPHRRPNKQHDEVNMHQQHLEHASQAPVAADLPAGGAVTVRTGSSSRAVNTADGRGSLHQGRREFTSEGGAPSKAPVSAALEKGWQWMTALFTTANTPAAPETKSEVPDMSSWENRLAMAEQLIQTLPQCRTHEAALKGLLAAALDFCALESGRFEGLQTKFQALQAKVQRVAAVSGITASDWRQMLTESLPSLKRAMIFFVGPDKYPEPLKPQAQQFYQTLNNLLEEEALLAPLSETDNVAAQPSEADEAEERALLEEQNQLLREINQIIRENIQIIRAGIETVRGARETLREHDALLREWLAYMQAQDAKKAAKRQKAEMREELERRFNLVSLITTVNQLTAAWEDGDPRLDPVYDPLWAILQLKQAMEQYGDVFDVGQHPPTTAFLPQWVFDGLSPDDQKIYVCCLQLDVIRLTHCYEDPEVKWRKERRSDLLNTWHQLCQHIADYTARFKHEPLKPLEEKPEASSPVNSELASQPLAHTMCPANETHAENVSEHVPELAFERPAPAMSNPEQVPEPAYSQPVSVGKSPMAFLAPPRPATSENTEQTHTPKFFQNA